MTEDTPNAQPAGEDLTTPPPVPDAEDRPTPSDEDKMMAMLAHLLPIVAGFVGPLIIWLVKKDSSKFVEDQAKEALNFQLVMLIGWVLCIVLTVVTCGFGAILTVPLMVVLMVVVIIFAIMAGLKAKEGEWYRYPFNIRMIK